MDVEILQIQTMACWKKIERLKKVRNANCTCWNLRQKKDGTECPSMTEIIRMLEQNGMKIVKGTH